MSAIAHALEVPPTSARRRFDSDAGVLIGGECQDCGAQTWPRRSVCYRCGGVHITDVSLPATGRLTTWTQVWVPVEGIQPPYMVGLVELGGVQLFGHVRGIEDETGAPRDVRVRVDREEKPPFWFEPVDS